MPSITKERERAHTDQDAWQPGMGDSRSVSHVPGASSKEPELHKYLASLEYWSAVCPLPTSFSLARSLSRLLGCFFARAPGLTLLLILFTHTHHCLLSLFFSSLLSQHTQESAVRSENVYTVAVGKAVQDRCYAYKRHWRASGVWSALGRGLGTVSAICSCPCWRPDLAGPASADGCVCVHADHMPMSTLCARVGVGVGIRVCVSVSARMARASVCVCASVCVSVNQAAQGLHFSMCVCPFVNPEPGSQFLDATRCQLDAACYCVTRHCLAPHAPP